MKLDHVGIAVWDLEESTSNFCKIFDVDPASVRRWEGFSGNMTNFITIGKESLEVMSPIEGEKGEGDVRKFLEEKDEGIMQMAYLVEDVEKTVIELISKGIPVKRLDPIDDYHHAMIKPCKITNQIMIYFFNKHYDP